MKLQNIYLILLCCLSASFMPSKRLKLSIKIDDCQTVIDSAKIFIQTSPFAVNIKPTIKDSERNLRLDQWLQKLSFKNLTCLLESENISLKAIGFMYAALSHTDSLLKDYSYLLIDTSAVQLFMAEGSKGPRMKLGELLSTMTQKINEHKDDLAKRPELEGAVSAFIREYSTYPATYKPLSFPHFSYGSDNEGLTDFNISHDYEIKNNEGKNVRVINAFVFDKNLGINVIEKDSSSYISSYPPKLDYWLKEFGRKLTKSDSLTLRIQNYLIHN